MPIGRTHSEEEKDAIPSLEKDKSKNSKLRNKSGQPIKIDKKYDNQIPDEYIDVDTEQIKINVEKAKIRTSGKPRNLGQDSDKQNNYYSSEEENLL